MMPVNSILSVFLLVLAAFFLVACLVRMRHSRRAGEKLSCRRRLNGLLGVVGLFLAILGLAVSPSGHALLAPLVAWRHNSFALGNLIWSAMMASLIYGLGGLVRSLLMSGTDDLRVRHKIRRTIFWACSTFFVIGLALIWAERLQGLGVVLGMMAAGVALSLQETLLCVAGWGLLMIRRPFDIGDRIEIGEIVGDVIDIRLFQMTLLEVGNWVDGDQSTGRMVHVPNSNLFRTSVYNYTQGFPFIWNELTLVVTFASDWRKAKEILLHQAEEEAGKIEHEVAKQIKKMQGDYAIRYGRLTPIVYTAIESNGVSLTLRYLTPVRRRRGTTAEICEGVLDEFARDPDIHFAYMTQTLHTVLNRPDRESLPKGQRLA
ncbi:MAG: mechanosensitive ion channel family protein [Planctomycetota bacterium]|jgi:small-conductance mechanosensitive channel